MIKHGCMALVAIACSALAPAAHAQGNFFVAGQVGQAKYDDSGFDDASADTRVISGGYRWQAGPIVQIGFEAGLGKVDEITQDYYLASQMHTDTGRIGMEADYRNLGANARFNFGSDSRWFAIARAGYIAYEMDAHTSGVVTWFDGSQVEYNESGSDNGGGAYFGAGIGVDLTPNVNLNVMYNSYAYSDFESDSYSEEDIGTASTTTVGIEVRL